MWVEFVSRQLEKQNGSSFRQNDFCRCFTFDFNNESPLAETIKNCFRDKFVSKPVLAKR